jgi:hypothetical protein
MNEHTTEKIECPSCGQRYTVEITHEDQDITCQACHAVFTVARVPESQVSAKKSMQPSSINNKPLSPSKNPKISVSFLDRFISLLFRFGKSFAGLLALLCLLAALISIGVFAWNLHSNFEVPIYTDIAPSASNQTNGSSQDTSELDEKRKIEKKYGDEVAKIIKDYKFAENDYYTILSMVQSMQNDNRARFLNGLEDVLSSHAEAVANDAKNTSSVQSIAGRYAHAFSSAERSHESKIQSAKATRWYALGAAFIFCFMLFMMLAIPALLKIEENTRKIA